MRSAPAVTVLCGGGALWRHTQWVLPAAAAAALAFWLAQHAGLPQGLGLALCLFCLLCLLCGGTAAFLASRKPYPTPELRWDGALWTCDGQPVQPQVMIDSGGSWMLLRLHRRAWPGDQPKDATLQPRSRWVAVSKRDCAADWHAWRAAVYCPSPEPSALGGARQSP